MGELSLWDKIKQWWEEEINKEALFERIFNKETVIGFFVGGATLGLWAYMPDKFSVVAAALVWGWSTWKIAQNKKKEIRKAVEQAKAL